MIEASFLPEDPMDQVFHRPVAVAISFCILLWMNQQSNRIDHRGRVADFDRLKADQTIDV